MVLTETYMQNLDYIYNILNEAEKDALEYVLSKGRGLTCKTQKQAKESYPNLISREIVYLDTWGKLSCTLRLTTKGETFINQYYKA